MMVVRMRQVNEALTIIHKQAYLSSARQSTMLAKIHSEVYPTPLPNEKQKRAISPNFPTKSTFGEFLMVYNLAPSPGFELSEVLSTGTLLLLCPQTSNLQMPDFLTGITFPVTETGTSERSVNSIKQTADIPRELQNISSEEAEVRNLCWHVYS